jgi:hypothetical protein
MMMESLAENVVSSAVPKRPFCEGWGRSIWARHREA